MLFLLSAESIGHAFHESRRGNRMLLSAGAMFRSLAYTRREQSLLRGGRRHAPDDIANIIRDEQSASPVDCHAYGGSS